MSSQASHALKKKHSPLVPKQLDAVLLDEYLSSLLNAKVLFRYFPLAEADGVSNVLQESLIPILTLFFSRGKTPACQALGLQITSKERQHRQTFLLRLAVYAFLSFVLPQLYQYTKGKWMEQHQQQRHENSTPAKSLHPLAQERRQRVVKIFFRTMDAATPILRLGLLIRCWSGKQQSPSTSIGLWLAGLHYASTDGNSMLVPAPATTERSDRLYVSRDLHVLYGHRRWLHDEVMRLVPTTFSPLLHSSRETRDLVRSWIVRWWVEPFRRLWSQRVRPYQQTNKGCPLCHQTPILIPFVTNCGHTYCYACLWQHQRDQHPGTPPSCRVCHENISTCYPGTNTIAAA